MKTILLVSIASFFFFFLKTPYKLYNYRIGGLTYLKSEALNLRHIELKTFTKFGNNNFLRNHSSSENHTTKSNNVGDIADVFHLDSMVWVKLNIKEKQVLASIYDVKSAMKIHLKS